jgi:hypothetical protein
MEWWDFLGDGGGVLLESASNEIFFSSVDEMM